MEPWRLAQAEKSSSEVTNPREGKISHRWVCREIRQQAAKPPARRVDDRSAVASQHLVVGISAQKLHSVAQFMGAMTKGREYQVSFLAMISPPAQWAEHFGHEHRSPVIKMGTELIGKE